MPWRSLGPLGQQLSSLILFSRDNFEEEWHLVASGGFSKVFQARHKHWRTQYVTK